MSFLTTGVRYSRTLCGRQNDIVEHFDVIDRLSFTPVFRYKRSSDWGNQDRCTTADCGS